MCNRRDTLRPQRAFVFARVLCAWLALGCGILILPSRTWAQPQVQIPAEALTDEAEVKRVLQQGHDLETQRRWGEALSYYENAVRTYPERRDLLDRMTLARVHYDVCRRYQDSSFKAALKNLTERQTLDVYAEVLQKIDTHYVKQPNWHELASRGVDNLTSAFAEPMFREVNLAGASDEAVRALGEELQQRIKVTVVRSRQDAREVAAAVAKLASTRLGLRPQATVLEFASGATCALDHYSTFLTTAELEDQFSQIEGNFVGLGIELKAQEQTLAIVSVIPGGPAEAAGLSKGDRIVQVDQVSTSNVSTDEAANLLKGPDGSSVNLQVLGPDGQHKAYRLVRRRVDVPSIVDIQLLDRKRGIGYLRLQCFQKTTPRDLDAALWKLSRDGMKSLIIDVRGNPGGLLTASVEVADRFVDSGNIVSTRGRNPREDSDHRARNTGKWHLPLLVLIDGDTASASEIFAAAIRDHHRGTVIGERSYGKGSVQGIFPLDSSSAGLRLTTAKFYSPNGNAISDRGVSPDIVVRTVKKPVTELPNVAPAAAEDAVLDAALQVARNGLGERQARAE